MTTFSEASAEDILMISAVLHELFPRRFRPFEPAFAHRLMTAHQFASAVTPPPAYPTADAAPDVDRFPTTSGATLLGDA